MAFIDPGWFALAFSEDVPPKGVKPLKYFGQDLVLFRTEDGRAVIADAHCPHLGAHLGYDGKVEGEAIACPFHGWRYDPEGRCEHVPFADRIPPSARIRVWPVTEQSGMIFAWHDLDGRPPAWTLPTYDETTRLPEVLPKDHQGAPEEAVPTSVISSEVLGGGITRVESRAPRVPGVTTVYYVSAAPVDEPLTHYRVNMFLLVDKDCPLTEDQLQSFNKTVTEHGGPSNIAMARSGRTKPMPRGRS